MGSIYFVHVNASTMILHGEARDIDVNLDLRGCL